MRFFTLTLLVALSFAPQARAQLDSTRQSFEQKLEAAVEELNALRERITEEKLPLVKAVNALESEVLENREAVRSRQRQRDVRSVSLDRLRNDVAALEDEQGYISGLLNEFARSFDSRIHVAEKQVYDEESQEALRAQLDPDLSEREKIEAQLALLDTALARAERIRGGDRFEGQALRPETGELSQGTFVVYGPEVYFAGADGQLAGLTQLRVNAAEPSVIDLGPEAARGIVNLARDGEGNIPLDPTLGDAIKIKRSESSMVEHIQKGRGVGYVIIGLGLLALVIAGFKLADILGFPTPKPKQLDEILVALREGRDSDALAQAGRIKGIPGRMLEEGVRARGQDKVILEEIMFEEVLRARPRLERFLPFLAITAAAAPLMGLLGTVIGMIRTFNLIAVFGTGDAKPLSSGISEALVTTELGLVVAIPALVLHGLLARLAKRKLGDMEQAAVGFVNGVSRAKAQEKPQPVEA